MQCASGSFNVAGPLLKSPITRLATNLGSTSSKIRSPGTRIGEIQESGGKKVYNFLIKFILYFLW